MLVQGDTLKMLDSIIREARSRQDIAERDAALRDAAARVRRFLDLYESALAERGQRLPMSPDICPSRRGGPGINNPVEATC